MLTVAKERSGQFFRVDSNSSALIPAIVEVAAPRVGDAVTRDL